MSEMEDATASLGNIAVEDLHEVRDRRLEVIQQLASFPSLKQFFSEIPDPIEVDGQLIQLLKPNSNP